MRTPAMTLAFVNVLRRLGVAYIVAEEEADSQIGRLYREQLVYAAISEDADLFAHGVKRLVCGITRRTFIWKFVDLELIDVTMVISDKSTPAWKAGLFQGMDVNYDLALALWCSLVGNDYHPGGVKGVGPKMAGPLVGNVMRKVDLSPSQLWTRVKAIATSAWRDLQQNLPESKRPGAKMEIILTGMSWFFCQKSYNLRTKSAARIHGLPPWVSLTPQPQGPAQYTDDERSAGSHLQGPHGNLCALTVVPCRTAVSISAKADILHIGDIAKDIPGMVLPAEVENCSVQDLTQFLHSFAGNTGRGTGLGGLPKGELQKRARSMLALEEANPTVARMCRQDPNGHGTAFYLRRLQLGIEAEERCPQVEGLPAPESFVFDNLFAVASHSPENFPVDVLKAWKDRRAAEDNRPELSDNTRIRILQKVKQSSLSLDGYDVSLSEAQKEEGILWCRGQVPASKTRGLRYRVYARIDFETRESGTTATAIQVFCTECDGGLRGACSHAGTFAELLCTVRKRAAALSEMSELIVTAGSNSWDRAQLDQECRDPTIPIHEQVYEGDGAKATARGSTKRRTHLEHEFDPRTDKGKAAKRTDKAVLERRQALMRLLRRDAWAERNTWTGEPLDGRTGEEIIAQRHANGQSCHLALDLYEGSSDGEYDYRTVEGW